jgi:holin-like protein
VLLPFSFPGSIIGMLLLFLALSLKLVSLSQVKPLTDIFLRYMPLFFIPAGVSVMSAFELINGELPLILLVLITSTLIVLSVTALIADKFIKVLEHE